MSASLEKTFQFLTKTENEAAQDVLIAGLDSPFQPTRDGALRALMDRRSVEGHDEIFRRLPKLDEHARAIVQERPDRLARVAADVIARSEGKPAGKRNERSPRRAPRSPGREQNACCPKRHRAACDAILSYRLYDAMPALVGAVTHCDAPQASVTVNTILKLTELFYEELSGSNQRPKRRDMEGIRRRMTDSLQQAAAGFGRHGCRQLVEAYLLIAKQQNANLRRILRRPDEKLHPVVVELLKKSQRGGIIRLLLSFLEDPQLPNIVLGIISARTDTKFVENLLRTVGARPSKAIAGALSRLKEIAWATPGNELLERLDDEAQRGAVGLLCASSLDRKVVLDFLGHILLHGKVGGRRAAAEALADFEGPEADALVLRGLADEDPNVRFHLIGQLRPRRIPGAMSLLIRQVDSSNETIREALRKAMPELTFSRFVASFDSLPDELRPTAGHLVRKIDDEAKSLLTKEITGLSPVRRRRAVMAANAMGLVEEMEEVVIGLLSDDDHRVRIAAAEALADCKTMPTWEALRDALLDRSVIVRETAEASLQQICQSLAEQEVEETEEVAP